MDYASFWRFKTSVDCKYYCSSTCFELFTITFHLQLYSFKQHYEKLMIFNFISLHLPLLKIGFVHYQNQDLFMITVVIKIDYLPIILFDLHLVKNELKIWSLQKDFLFKTMQIQVKVSFRYGNLFKTMVFKTWCWSLCLLLLMFSLAIIDFYSSILMLFTISLSLISY